MELFSNCMLLDGLNDEEMNRIESNMTKVQYSKGERIVKSEEFVTHIVYVAKGFVKLHSEVKGKEVILDIGGPNKFIGLSSMIMLEKHPFSITSLDDSIVCLIDIGLIRDLILRNGKFATNVVTYITDMTLHYIQHNLISLTKNNIHGRLANTLLYLSEIFGNGVFEIVLSRKELAQFSNISRENVIKTLYEFDSDGLIKLNGKLIQLLKKDQLHRLAELG